MPSFRKPGAPLGASTQAALYYARKRRRARIEGGGEVIPDDEIRISSALALGITLISDFSLEQQLAAQAALGLGVATGFSLEKRITATNHSLGAGQAVSVDVNISLHQTNMALGTDVAVALERFADVRATASLGNDMSANVFSSFDPIISSFNLLGIDQAAALTTFVSLSASHALGASMAATVTKNISISAAPALGLSEAAAVVTQSNPVVGSFVTGTWASPASMPHTFTSVSVGTAASDRFIVLGVARRTGSTITGVTIGGVTAVRVSGGTDSTMTQIWMAKVPTGTTANIVVSGGSVPSVLSYVVWRATGVKDTGTITDSVVQGGNATGTNPASLTLNGVENGYAFGISARAAVVSTTWTGSVEDSDDNSSGALTTSSARVLTTALGGTPTLNGSNQHVMTASQGATNNVMAGVCLYPV